MKSMTFAFLGSLALLAACGKTHNILPGTREAIVSTGIVRVANQNTPVGLVAPRVNGEWTHLMGDASHHIAHPVLAGLRPVYSVQAGTGQSRGTRISASPVIAGGRVFVMDAHAQVIALSPAGAQLWARDLVPAYAKARNGQGGGLAFGGGKLFATSGFGELSAIDPATGRVLWVQDLEAVGGSSPTYRDGKVYLVARDGTAWAIEASNGRIAWTQNGAPGEVSVGTGAGVALSRDLAIFPFPGGEVRAVFRQGGLNRWSAYIAGGRTGFAVSGFSELTGDPVIADGRVYVGNISGRAAALDLDSGEEIWSVPMAAKGPMQPGGNSVFFVNDLNQLVRVNSASGAVVWIVDLPKYAEKSGRASRFYAHYGPVLAGGRLIVASSDGNLRQFDPRSGALTGALALPAPAASQPSVAGGVLYVYDRSGTLTALR